jgi:hypothetical protein
MSGVAAFTAASPGFLTDFGGNRGDPDGLIP